MFLSLSLFQLAQSDGPTQLATARIYQQQQAVGNIQDNQTEAQPYRRPADGSAHIRPRADISQCPNRDLSGAAANHCSPDSQLRR